MSSVSQVGWFRTRQAEDGVIEVWARGWRLPSPWFASLPAALGVSFALGGFPILVRVVGLAGMLAVAGLVWRLAKLGIRFSERGVEVVGIGRTHQVGWGDFEGFVGERSREGGSCVLVRTVGEPIALPGDLEGEQMNPIGDEGDLSAVDELNRLAKRVRRGEPIAGWR
jgi:hypothetical protein